MRRLITLSAIAAILCLGAAPARSQDTGGDKSKKNAPKKEDAQHKGPEKKSKKGSGGSTTPPPK